MLAKVNEVSGKPTYILLLISLSGDDTIHTMHEELSKLFHLEVLPVLNTAGQVLQNLVKKITVHSLISLGQYSFSSLTTTEQIHLDFFILSLLVQILSCVSCRKFKAITSTHLEQERIFHQSLHRLQQETVEGVEVGCHRMRGTLNLVKNLVGNLGRLALVRDEWLINIESILIHDKWSSPTLVRVGHRICCLHTDQETSLEVENGIDVEEYLVKSITRNCTLLFERLLQIVQVLEILDVFSLGIDKFSDDVISVGHLSTIGFLARRILESLGLEEVAAFLRFVQDVSTAAIYELTNLDEATSVVTHQVGYHKAMGGGDLQVLHAGLNEFEDGDLRLLSFISASVLDLEVLVGS
ncbi:hypothetical protein HG530_007723 [Fusarium avenaceum]|nr:hypothetical protein HG530_007723 [Fusarium avenaceum]